MLTDGKNAAVSTNVRGEANYKKTYTQRGRSRTTRVNLKGYNTQCKGLEPKSESCTIPLIKRPGNLAKNTQSITKLFQCTPSQSPEARGLLQGKDNLTLALHNSVNSMCFNTPINRHAGGQIQLLSCTQSRESKKSVNSMGPPNMVNSLKNCIINGIVIMRWGYTA